MKHLKRGLISPALFSGSVSELLHPPASQIPFLDGLRSIAVLLVINSHLSAQFALVHGKNLYSGLFLVSHGAWVGVDLFFVLSGFFIGGQLWKELRDRGSIAVGRFILRRGFRIWPLYFFTFLCVLIFTLALGHGAAAKEYGWSDLIFITNFHNRGLVMGSWSLCTEEQFYIFAPLVLYFCARFVLSVRKFRPWLWGSLLAVLLLRGALWVHITGHFFSHSPALFAPIFYSSLTHCEGLIMGLIISNLWVTHEKPNSRFATPIFFIVVALALGIALHLLQKEIFDFTILALVCGSFVWFGLQSKSALFDSRIFYWISRLSYGMYLNHEYMCPWIARVLLPRLSSSAHFSAVSNLMGVVLVATFSAAIAFVTFCCVEYPFLQLRKAMLGRHTDRPNTRESIVAKSKVEEVS
jgi:peptidoglycan/LPS O-acetylase OafA/YrhL